MLFTAKPIIGKPFEIKHLYDTDTQIGFSVATKNLA